MKFRIPKKVHLAKRSGFSLVEVTVAMGIFFMCMYSLIVLTMKNLENARQLQFVEPDVGWVASELSLLSEVEEGPVDGSGDFGDHYPGWSWQGEVVYYPLLETFAGIGEDIETEGLYQVNIVVNGPGESMHTHSVLMYRGQQEGSNGVSRSRTGSSRSSSRSRTSSSNRSSSGRNRVDLRRDR